MTESTTTARAGKYLAFGLCGEEYGADILKVREIIKMMDITSVPRTPSFIRGIINLRGRVIPVMDLREKFGMPPADETTDGCIIVTEVGEVEMGVIVDRVSEVVDLAPDQIVEAPSFGGGIDTSFILAVGKVAQRVILLLDIDKVLTTEEMQALTEV